MSGGYFDHVQSRIGSAADELDGYIISCESDGPEYAAKTIEKMRECERTLRRAAAMLQRVDWLASGDDDEDSFHSRWEWEMSMFTDNELRDLAQRLNDVGANVSFESEISATRLSHILCGVMFVCVLNLAATVYLSVVVFRALGGL